MIDGMRIEDLMGKRVIDEVTGFVGTVTAYAVYHFDETQILVEGMDNSDNPVSEWYSAKRFSLIND